jgi:hypothetical protein
MLARAGARVRAAPAAPSIGRWPQGLGGAAGRQGLIKSSKQGGQ